MLLLVPVKYGKATIDIGSATFLTGQLRLACTIFVATIGAVLVAGATTGNQFATTVKAGLTERFFHVRNVLGLSPCNFGISAREAAKNLPFL